MNVSRTTPMLLNRARVQLTPMTTLTDGLSILRPTLHSGPDRRSVRLQRGPSVRLLEVYLLTSIAV
jgi:hypothetical protein